MIDGVYASSLVPMSVCLSPEGCFYTGTVGIREDQAAPLVAVARAPPHSIEQALASFQLSVRLALPCTQLSQGDRSIGRLICSPQ